MKRFKEFRIGDTFRSTCSITTRELDSYLGFARVKNAFLEGMRDEDRKMIPGRAILARMEGEFTRLSQIYGNEIVLVGSDGDPEWRGRNTRFVTPLHTDDVLDMQFVISGKDDIDDTYGRITVDYEGTNRDGETVLLCKRNIYRMKKDPPR